MTEKQWLEKLAKEGYTDLKIIPILPGEDPEHNHDYDTVNVILEGGLSIFDETGEHVYQAGDRIDTKAGTIHRAENPPGVGRMIVGVKKS